MLLFTILLFALPDITVVHSFTTAFSHPSAFMSVRQVDTSTICSCPATTQLRLAKRRVTPTKKSRQKKKQQSLESLIKLETDLHDRGYRYVIGSDDSGGAGCIAGPVVVASCCLLKPFSSFLQIPSQSASTESLVTPSQLELLSKVNDCKELKPEQRREQHLL